MNQPDTGIDYELSRTYSASPAAIFSALTNAAVLKRIWGVQEINVDARVGGQAVATYLVEGQDWSFTITYTEPAVKGDTANNVTKKATVETGAEINIPLFLDQGMRVKVDTRTGEYVERAK